MKQGKPLNFLDLISIFGTFKAIGTNTKELDVWWVI
jgi:hypothetical protein